MAVCIVCSKKRYMGRKISHSNIKTKKWKFPNIQHVKAMVEIDGVAMHKYVYACTRCIKSGFIEKAP